MAPAGLVHYLVVSAIVFALGMAVIVIRRNAIAVLMGVELVLNAAALNFIAFGRFCVAPGGVGIHDDLRGQAAAIFVIVLAAAEAAVALAIVLNLFANFDSVDVDTPILLKD